VAKRLNDTEALVARPFEGGEEHSISSRKISNGYITRTSSYNPHTCEYTSAEMFTKNPPKLQAPRMDGRSAPRDATGNNSLSDTKKYLGG
jgi:hypothetical protein